MTNDSLVFHPKMRPLEITLGVPSEFECNGVQDHILRMSVTHIVVDCPSPGFIYITELWINGVDCMHGASAIDGFCFREEDPFRISAKVLERVHMKGRYTGLCPFETGKKFDLRVKFFGQVINRSH